MGPVAFAQRAVLVPSAMSRSWANSGRRPGSGCRTGRAAAITSHTCANAPASAACSSASRQYVQFQFPSVPGDLAAPGRVQGEDGVGHRLRLLGVDERGDLVPRGARHAPAR
ncbi:hypothetical protein [Actinomadura opuntiae]|uniref:hypothetical protein n=1 Tax=Actinomadura sp. OS1-43 TaxID=604315 RepID=UPI00255B0192|nr:hypothetical protein [Actinomadura sp. OS1-43]MDL4815379.1 hypothetical protein [Actinomadura sp. OS1-43]